MSQARELEDHIYETAKAECWQPSQAEEHFRGVCECLEWDEDIVDAYASGLSDRVQDWINWCNSENIRVEECFNGRSI
jgi:hypothetical protein